MSIYGGITLVTAMEATLAAAFNMNEENTGMFDDIWSSLLARGAELVV